MDTTNIRKLSVFIGAGAIAALVGVLFGTRLHHGYGGLLSLVLAPLEIVPMAGLLIARHLRERSWIHPGWVLLWVAWLLVALPLFLIGLLGFFG